jgi:hypothetical protein
LKKNHAFIVINDKPKLNVEIMGAYITEGIWYREGIYYEPSPNVDYSSLYVINLTIELTEVLLPGVQWHANVGAYSFGLKCESKNIGFDQIHFRTSGNDINLLGLSRYIKPGDKISGTMVFPYFKDNAPIALIIHAPNYDPIEIIL